MARSESVARSGNETQTWGLFLLLSLIWGSSYLLIKILLDEGVAPLTIVALRTMLGSAFLGVVVLWQRARLPRSLSGWGHLSVVAMTNIVIPYALITWGELTISSGMAGILTAMVPLFSVVLASVVLHDEPITVGRVGGLTVGFVGVVLLAAPSLDLAGVDGAAPPIAGMVAVGLAALSYAVAAVYVRHNLSGKPIVREASGEMRAPSSLEISFGQVFVGMLVITALALLFERPDDGLLGLPATGEAIVAMILLGLFGTGVAYLLYFSIIGRWGATRATLIAYVMPIVAIVLGFLVLDERLQLIEAVGAGLIIGGVVLVNARIGQRVLFNRGAS